MMKKGTTKILLIDDHALVRSAIRELLQQNATLQVIAEATTGQEGIELAKQHHPDLVLLDLQLPDLTGMEVAKRLLHINSTLKILAVSAHFDEPYLSQLLKIGVSGCLPKTAGYQEFLMAIEAVQRDECFIGQQLAEKITLAYLNKEQSPFENLSARELDILLLLCQGDKSAIIAKKLFISPKTVNAHRQQLFKKLGVTNNIELAKLAIQYGLIDPNIN